MCHHLIGSSTMEALEPNCPRIYICSHHNWKEKRSNTNFFIQLGLALIVHQLPCLSKPMKFQNPNIPALCSTHLHVILLITITYYACNLPLLLPSHQTRLIVWLCSNLKNPLPMTHMECWAHGMILSNYQCLFSCNFRGVMNPKEF